MLEQHPHAVCGAKTRSGTPCQRAPMANGRCYMHGGATPRGFDLPQTTHGRYSKALPARMQAAYEDALNDPQLMDLKRSVAVIDLRLIDLLGRVDSGESGAVWRAIEKAFGELRDATARGKDGVADFNIAMAHLGAAIHRGHDDYQAWGEIQRLLDDRRKHVETQQRIETAGEKSVPATEVVTLIGAILAVAQEAIKDSDDRKRFVQGLEPLITARTQQIQ